MIAYGGSGPVHAAGLADDLGVTTVLVPPWPVCSAPSACSSPDPSSTRFARVTSTSTRSNRRDHFSPRRDGDGARRAFAGRSEPKWLRSADLRYGGQSWEIEVELPPGPVDRTLLAGLRSRFEDEHEVLYGVRGQPGSPVEVRAVRLAALGAPLCRRRSRSPMRSSRPSRDPSDVARRRGGRRRRCGRGRRSARTPRPARCSSTSTTRRSSCRRAGAFAVTSRRQRSCSSGRRPVAEPALAG